MHFLKGRQRRNRHWTGLECTFCRHGKGATEIERAWTALFERAGGAQPKLGSVGAAFWPARARCNRNWTCWSVFKHVCIFECSSRLKVKLNCWSVYF